MNTKFYAGLKILEELCTSFMLNKHREKNVKKSYLQNIIANI